MAHTDMKKVGLGALVVLVVVFAVYQYDPYLFKRFLSFEGFEDTKDAKDTKDTNSTNMANPTDTTGSNGKPSVNGMIPISQEKNTDDKKNEKKDTMKEKFEDKEKEEGFGDLSAYEGKADFGSAEAPAGCYPRDQLTPSELLPKDMNSIWAEQNPMGPGSLKGKNFLSAGALIGVNTVGQSLRNANLQVRSEPPNPQVAVSIFNQSTIAPDISHRPLEIGS